MKTTHKWPLMLAFEGIDGSGKTSIINEVNRILQSKGYSTLLLSESSTEIVRKNIFNNTKTLSVEEQALFWMNARLTLNEVIKTGIKSGVQFILYDRYFDSTAAYLNLIEYNQKLLEFNYAPSVFKYPDVVFYIDCDPNHALSRILSRGDDKSDVYQSEKLEKLNEYRTNYEYLYSSYYYSSLDISVVKLNSTFTSIETNANRVINHLELVYNISDQDKHNNSLINSMSDMQWNLNCKIGIDTRKSLSDLELSSLFIDFSQALIDETEEAKNCISWKWWTKEAKENGRFSQFIDEKNFKIELVDMFHFILSLCHITGHTINLNTQNIDRYRIIDDLYFRVKHHDYIDEKTIYEKLFLLLDDIIYTLYETKYNSTTYYYIEREYYVKPKIEFQSCVNKICNLYFVLLDLYGFKVSDLYDLYCKKNKVNFNRQNNEYSAITKTEDDNNELKKQL